MRPEGACRNCRFWDDGCLLIRENRAGDIIDHGACRPWSWVGPWIDRFLRLHHADLASEQDDLLQDLQLFLRRPKFQFPEDFVPDERHLRPYLRAVVLNRASDVLRRERLVPKIRCGVCLYRGASGTCSRTLTKDEMGRERPHPHYQKHVDPGSNPQALRPPCQEFCWRYRPVRLDEISQRKKAARAPESLASEEAAGLLALALEELVRAGPTGRRHALVLKEHFLVGRTATAIAAQLDLNERTVRRNLKSGLEALRTILTERIGVDEADLL